MNMLSLVAVLILVACTISFILHMPTGIIYFMLTAAVVVLTVRFIKGDPYG